MLVNVFSFLVDKHSQHKHHHSWQSWWLPQQDNLRLNGHESWNGSGWDAQLYSIGREFVYFKVLQIQSFIRVTGKSLFLVFLSLPGKISDCRKRKWVFWLLFFCGKCYITNVMTEPEVLQNDSLWHAIWLIWMIRYCPFIYRKSHIVRS